MSDLFKEKAGDWDASQMRQALSAAIGSAIVEHVALEKDMQVMDFGAGTGLLTAHVAPRVKNISAIDTSSSMLDQLANKPEFNGKVIPVCQDITRQPLDMQFDLIISAMAMHHVKDTTALLKTFSQHLASGGQIALADLDEEDGSFHPADIEGVFHHGFNRDSLRTLLENSGFKNIQFYTAHTVEKEGKHYPIFLLTAVKQ